MAAPVHWLRGNASEWSPRYVGFFDTETYPVTVEDGREELRLRLWVAGVVDRRPTGRTKPEVTTAVGTTRHELAAWVDRAMVGKPNMWLYAHNLGFDLTVSRLPDMMVARGWRLGSFRFGSRSMSSHLTRRSKTVWLVDSASLLPHPLAKVGAAVGRRKLGMPATDAPLEAWADYCTGDVLVLADAVLTLLDWWDREHLGHWAKSGAGCGWNAFRHMSRAKPLLMRPDPAELGEDRRAIFGGRRDVTRVGAVAGGPFALVDFQDAYLTTLAYLPTPKARMPWQELDRGEMRRLAGIGYGVLAEVTVDTPTARYPLRTPRGVFYPVGRFRTVLTQPEIDAAERYGDLVDIHAGHVHDIGYPLQTFAHWALNTIGPDAAEVPAVVKMMVKQWGRAVPGRFAMHISRTLWTGPALWPGWHLERGTSGPDHAPAVNYHVGGRQWWDVRDQEADNTYPAVLAWVEAHVRVRLNRMLDELGEDMWVVCDTDGLVLNLERAPVWLSERLGRRWRSKDPLRAVRAVCDVLAAITGPLVPRVKGVSETLTVAGPQHYSGDTFTRAAGRPGKPEIDDQGELHWWSWPKVGWQMEHGAAGGYVRVERAWTEPAVTAHRWVLADGWAVAPETWPMGDGTYELAAWELTAARGGGVRLGAVQVPALHGLY